MLDIEYLFLWKKTFQNLSTCFEKTKIACYRILKQCRGSLNTCCVLRSACARGIFNERILLLNVYPYYKTHAILN